MNWGNAGALRRSDVLMCDGRPDEKVRWNLGALLPGVQWTSLSLMTSLNVHMTSWTDAVAPRSM